MAKAAVVIFTELDSHQNMARVVNALEVAREFKEAGDDVQIIFDGGGTVAAAYITGQTLYVDGGLTLYPDFRTAWSSE